MLQWARPRIFPSLMVPLGNALRQSVHYRLSIIDGSRSPHRAGWEDCVKGYCTHTPDWNEGMQTHTHTHTFLLFYIHYIYFPNPPLTLTSSCIIITPTLNQTSLQFLAIKVPFYNPIAPNYHKLLVLIQLHIHTNDSTFRSLTFKLWSAHSVRALWNIAERTEIREEGMKSERSQTGFELEILSSKIVCSICLLCVSLSQSVTFPNWFSDFKIVPFSFLMVLTPSS